MATFSLSSYFSVRLLAVPVMSANPDVIERLALLGTLPRLQSTTAIACTSRSISGFARPTTVINALAGKLSP